MELNKDYLRFCRWWEESQQSFHCGQFDDRQIALAAWREGQKQQIQVNKSSTVCIVKNDGSDHWEPIFPQSAG